jgi:hypothetical protein
MRAYTVPRQIWRAIYPLLIWFASAAVVLFLMTEDTFNSFGEIAVYAVQITVFSLMWHKTKKRLPVYDGMEPLLFSSVLVVFAFAALNLVYAAVSGMFDLIRFFPSYEQIVELYESRSLLMKVLTAVIAAPVIEELLNRGIILNRLLTWMSPKIAVILSSAIFGVMHWNLFQGLYACIAGIFFSLLYLRCRNIWLPIAAHMAFNLTSIILIETMNAAGAEYINAFLLLVPSTLAAAVCVWLLMNKTKPARLSGVNPGHLPRP